MRGGTVAKEPRELFGVRHCQRSGGRQPSRERLVSMTMEGRIHLYDVCTYPPPLCHAALVECLDEGSGLRRMVISTGTSVTLHGWDRDLGRKYLHLDWDVIEYIRHLQPSKGKLSLCSGRMKCESAFTIEASTPIVASLSSSIPKLGSHFPVAEPLFGAMAGVLPTKKVFSKQCNAREPPLHASASASRGYWQRGWKTKVAWSS